MRTETRKDLAAICQLAAPIIMENVLQSLLGTVDTYFAGQLEDLAIAGIGVTNLIMNVYISFFTAVSVGTVAVVSRYYGRKEYGHVNRAMVHSLAAATVMGCLMGMISAFFGTPILRLSGAKEDIMTCVMPYYMVVAVPCVALCLQLVLSACLRAIKDTRTPMYVTALSNILNVILNAVSMELGLGIFGLGLATTLSRCVGAAVLFLRLRKSDRNIDLSPCNLTRREFHTILRIGIPAGGEKLIMRIGQLVYGSMIISLGSNAYVAHNIAGNLESYCSLPTMGFGLAVCTMIGVSLGENNIPQAKRQTAIAYGLSAVSGVIIGVAILLLAPQLTALFTKTAEIQQMASQVLRIPAVVMPFSALVQIMNNALQGAGDTKFPMYTTFFGIWGIRVCVGYLLGVVLGLGLLGVWLAYGLDVIVRGLLLWCRYRRGAWMKIAI